MDNRTEYTEAWETLNRIKGKLLRTIERITDEAPEGAVTEAQYKAGTEMATYKLIDLVASYNNVTGKSGGGDRAVEIINRPR